MRTVTAALMAIRCWPGAAQQANKPTVLVVSADTENYLLSAGGAIADMVDRGAVAYVIRVTNDDKDAWDLSPEEAANRTRVESEAGGAFWVSRKSYRWVTGPRNLRTSRSPRLRDRLMVYIRHYRPR